MAHVVKDSMNHYAIEVKRGPKHVQCIIRLNGEVEFKQYPLTKMIADHENNTNDGTYQFDKRWAPCTEEQDAGCNLTRVIDSFLDGMLPVTDKARRMLEALRADPGAVAPITSTNDNEDTQMATKTKKVKKAKVPKERAVKDDVAGKFKKGEKEGRGNAGKVYEAFGNGRTAESVAESTKIAIAYVRSCVRHGVKSGNLVAVKD